MEDTSSAKEGGSAPVCYPWSFHEFLRAVLRCLGLENESQHNPSPSLSPNKQANNINSAGREASKQEEEGEASTANPNSDPPNTATDTDPTSEFDDPPPSTTAEGDPAALVVSFAAPTRPGTRSGSGGQTN